MKNIFFLLTITIFSIASFSFTGSDFEGKIVYTIDIDNPNLPPAAKAMLAGSELSIYIKGAKSRSDMSMAMQNTSTISDAQTNTSVVLMELMGNKYKIKNDMSKLDTAKTPDVSVEYLNETKEIAGYKCKKAQMTFKDKSGKPFTTDIYYTEEITNHLGYDNRSSQFKKLKGMPLEYEMNGERGMKMKMTAKSVSKYSVADSKFYIPEGYKETTLEDMQKDIRKMMENGQR
jgi:GLPGLI family protein